MILVSRHYPIENPLEGFFENIISATENIIPSQQSFSPYLAAKEYQNPELAKVDISETNEAFLLRLELPGFEKKNLEVKFENDRLIVRGAKENDLKNTKVIYQERQYGNFIRKFSLPRNVAASKLSASFKDGLLTISVPKLEQAKVREVQIEN